MKFAWHFKFLHIVVLLLATHLLFSDLSGAVLSSRASPENPVQGSSLVGYCNASNSTARITGAQYQWYKDGMANLSGEVLFGGSVSAGQFQSCAIRANDSQVLCWGGNAFGQLGDGTTTQRTNPAPINDTSACSSVSAGAQHTCAIRQNDSRVLCWGYNFYGRLGDGTTTQRTNPTLINDTSACSSVSAGYSHTCAIRQNDSRVLCWGANSYGQLGDGTTTQRTNPTPVNDTSACSSASSGTEFSCALRQNDSRVLCWGRNSKFQVGDNSTEDRLNPVLIQSTATYNAISSGKTHACAMRQNDSRVLCWGWNDQGQLGDGTTTEKYNPAQIRDAAEYRLPAPGDMHTCALRQNDSRLFCWGNNEQGQLGDGTTKNKYDPTQINDSADYVSISAGQYHTCAIRQNDSRVLCWGANSYGQLGDGTTDQRTNPAPINDTAAYSAIGAGDDSACGIRANDSQVLCWGHNADGQLGDGTTTDRHNPTPINDTSAYSAVAGAYHACAIRQNDSHVLCWGDNTFGQLGDGTTTDRHSPTPINDTSAYSAIVLAGHHTCAIRQNDSHMLCWGANSYGQLGDGTTTQRTNPTPINDTSAYLAASAGIDHTCAIRQNDSQVLCWGGNYYGSLGDGTITDRFTPTPINSTAAYSSVSASDMHTCAIRQNDSRVLCWGDNQFGELAEGITVPQLISDSSPYCHFGNGTEVFVSSISLLLTQGEHWQFSCRAISESGNSSWAGNSSATINFEALGNSSDVAAPGISNLTVKVNGSAQLHGVGFGQNATVEFSDGSLPIASFSYNFTAGSLNLSQVNITNGTSGGKAYISISGISPPALVGAKTLYIHNAGASYAQLCVKDEGNVSAEQISSACTGSNETLLTCNGTVGNGKWCNMSGTMISIHNLTHSAAIQFSSGGAAASGGGSGLLTPSLGYSFNCSSGALAVLAKSAGASINGLMVRLKDPTQMGWLDTAATNSQGIAYFTINESRRYSVESVQSSGYSSAYIDAFFLAPCPPPTDNQTAEPSQPPQEQPSEGTAGQPQPPANASASLPEVSQGTGANGTQPLPQKPAITVQGMPPEVKQAAKEAAVPALSLAIIGAGALIIMFAIAAYVYFKRKGKPGTGIPL